LQHDEPEKEALATKWIKANAPDPKVLPLVNNYREDAARWDGAAAAKMLSTKKMRAGFGEELYQFVRDGGYAGAVLDLARAISIGARCNRQNLDAAFVVENLLGSLEAEPGGYFWRRIRSAFSQEASTTPPAHWLRRLLLKSP
jgi:hypothetical protein